MVKEKPRRKMAKPIQYKNYAQNQARSLKLLSIKPYVAKRGKGIPLEIRREIAKIFKAHGFDKSSKMEAQKLYQERTNSADVLHRYFEGASHVTISYHFLAKNKDFSSMKKPPRHRRRSYLICLRKVAVAGRN